MTVESTFPSSAGPETTTPRASFSDFTFLGTSDSESVSVYGTTIQHSDYKNIANPKYYVGHTSEVTKVASSRFAAAPEVLVSGGKDGAVYLWSLKDQKLRAKCYGHKGPITALSIDSKEAMAVSCAEKDADIRVWNPADGSEIAKLTCTDQPTSVAIDPSGSFVVATTTLNALQIWTTSNWQKTHQPVHPKQYGTTQCVIALPGFAVSCARSISIWDVQTGKLVHENAYPWGQITTCWASTSLQHIWVAQSTGNFRYLDRQNNWAQAQLNPNQGPAIAGSSSKNDTRYGFSTGDRVVQYKYP